MGLYCGFEDKSILVINNLSTEKVYYKCYMCEPVVIFPNYRNIIFDKDHGYIETVDNIKINIFDKDNGIEIINVSGLIIKINHEDANTQVNISNN